MNSFNSIQLICIFIDIQQYDCMQYAFLSNCWILHDLYKLMDPLAMAIQFFKSMSQYGEHQCFAKKLNKIETSFTYIV